MRRLTVLLVVAALFAAASSSGLSAAATSTAVKPAATTAVPSCKVATQTKLARIDLKVGGKSRYALVHMPAHWNGKTRVPVVLSFHGLGASALSQRSTDGFVARSDKDNFIVVHPQAGGGGSFGAAWDLSGAKEIPFVTAILDNLERRACVDTSRVYATGLSYGGAMTDLIACKLSKRIAAVAPVSAYLPKWPCTPSRRMPVMSFHGVEDYLLPYAGGGPFSQQAFETWGADWAKRDGCVGAPTVKQYKPTVEELRYQGCKAPVVLYRVHQNGHTWPGHPLNLNRQALIDFFSGKTTGTPFPLMVAAGLTPEEFTDTILLANMDIDASAMILAFFRRHTLAN